MARDVEVSLNRRTSNSESISKDLIFALATYVLCGKFLLFEGALRYRSDGYTDQESSLFCLLTRTLAGCNQSNDLENRRDPHPLDLGGVAPTGHFEHCLGDLLPIEHRS
jgi:hypothetical protein